MTNLPVNWVDDIGMIEDAAFLNLVGTNVNANTAAIAALDPDGPGRAASVSTSESTTSTSYTDLTTITDTVTVTVGSRKMVLVLLAATLSNATVNPSTIRVSFAASGANTLAAADSRSIPMLNTQGTPSKDWFLLTVAELPNTGSTVFKMKYKASAGTMGVQDRKIIVIPL